MLIQGIDATDPGTGKTNRKRLHDETGDVIAQIECNVEAFALDFREIELRSEEKVAMMAEWEEHF